MGRLASLQRSSWWRRVLPHRQRIVSSWHCPDVGCPPAQEGLERILPWQGREPRLLPRDGVVETVWYYGRQGVRDGFRPECHSFELSGYACGRGGCLEGR